MDRERKGRANHDGVVLEIGGGGQLFVLDWKLWFFWGQQLKKKQFIHTNTYMFRLGWVGF